MVEVVLAPNRGLESMSYGPPFEEFVLLPRAARCVNLKNAGPVIRGRCPVRPEKVSTSKP